ncbi:MAG: hypothetical protein KC422_05340 [Trueperaceae bacterium]|nr:hypothetical protein [Trueperaceae bacterium]
MRQEKVFVLRLWSDSESTEIWRASLEDIKSKELNYFASLEHFSSYLHTLAKVKLGSSKD